jgi:TP901 family phage tail tape measure protein
MANMRTIGVRLRMETGDYTRDTERAGQATDRLRGRMRDAGEKGKADLDKLAMGAGLLGAALVGVAGAAVYAAAKFDKQMSEVQAVSNATADELDALRKAAIDAGQATVFSAKDAAEAEAELAKAGISTSDILGGALKGSLDLAAAGSLDLARSAEIASAAMNTFALKGSDVGHVADVLSAAANKSAAGVDDLGMGLQQVGLVAAQAGLSFEETVGLLAAMADRGLKGSDGATSLKTALQRLVAPTEKSAETMQSLGISMYDSAGQMVSAADIAGQLQTALKDLSPAQRNAALQTMFGSDAIRAANVLYSEGADGIQDYIRAVDDQGAAARVAATKLDNLAGDVEQLTGSLETLFIQSGEGASGGLRLLVQQATNLTNMFGALPGPVQSTVVVLAGLSGVALLAASAGLKLRGRVSEIVEELNNAGPAGARAGSALAFVARWAGRAAIALGALTAAGEILRSIVGETEIDMTNLNESLERFAKTGKVTGEMARLFGSDLGEMGEQMAIATSSFGDFMRGVEAFIPLIGALDHLADMDWTQPVENFRALDEELTQMIRSGHADTADAIFRRLWESAQGQGVDLEKLQSLFPSYVAAYREASLATGQQAAAAAEARDANIKLAGAFGEAASQAAGLIDAYKELNGVTLTWREAERAAEEAVDNLQAALKESAGSLDVHNEKGRAAAEAVDKLATAAAEAAQAEFNRVKAIDGEAAATAAAAKVWNGYIAMLREILNQAGLSKAKIDELILSVGQMPSQKTITINAKLNLTGQAQLNRVIADLEELNNPRRWGGITEHAATGLLRDASIYAPAAPARYGFAEPATGGEAFVPKRGDYSRSMGILQHAAGWYGADVVPRGGGWYGGAAPAVSAGAAGPVNVDVHVDLDGQAIEPRMIRVISERDRQLRRQVVGRRGR